MRGRYVLRIVEEKRIAPHVPVWDRTERQDGTLSSSEFLWDEEANEYRCPQGHALLSDRRQFTKPRDHITKAGTIIYAATKHDCNGCPDEAAVLPQHSGTQDHSQRARTLKRRGARHRHHSTVQAVQTRSQEGRDTIRAPQTRPEGRPATPTRAVRRARRVPAGSNRSELEANGEAVARRSKGNDSDSGLRTPQPLQQQLAQSC